MKVLVGDFLARVAQILDEGPTYRHGGFGKDGTCDCIGLIIGAIRRAGGQWRGLHGSNYAARSEVEQLQQVADPAMLEIGEAVFKAREPGAARYDLPEKYGVGGASYNGDLRDYYHVGVVMSVNPLRIYHMTSPKGRIDTKIGSWGWHGWLKKVARKDEEKKAMDVLYQATVVGGGVLNMRIEPDRSAKLIMQIPEGASVDVVADQDRWSQIVYRGRSGWVMNEFLRAGGETIVVQKEALQGIYDILGDMLGLRG